LKTII
jgi:hypothetical protein